MPAHHHSPARPRGDTATSAAGRERRALGLAVALTVGFGLVEAAGGWFAGSLALLADAGHMVTDAAALGIALLAQHVARLPPSRRASYGYARAEVIAAFINALLMLAVVVGISVEAVRRLLAPSPVAGGMVMAIATVGLLINMFAAWNLSHGHSLNSPAALLSVWRSMVAAARSTVPPAGDGGASVVSANADCCVPPRTPFHCGSPDKSAMARLMAASAAYKARDE